MEILCALLITAIVIIVVLFSQLSYKNHCIEDLDNRLSKESERKNKDFVALLKLLKKYQSFEPASRDTLTRRLIDESIIEYSNENSAFERMLEEACIIYAKKELDGINKRNETI